MSPTTQNFQNKRRRATVPGRSLHNPSLEGSIVWLCRLEWTVWRLVLGRDSTLWTIYRRHRGCIAVLGSDEASAPRAIDKAPTKPFHGVRIACIETSAHDSRQKVPSINSPGTRTLSQNPPLRMLSMDNIPPRSSG